MLKSTSGRQRPEQPLVWWATNLRRADASHGLQGGLLQAVRDRGVHQVGSSQGVLLQAVRDRGVHQVVTSQGGLLQAVRDWGVH